MTRSLMGRLKFFEMRWNTQRCNLRRQGKLLGVGQELFDLLGVDGAWHA
jgi:hypothetical protein